MANLEATVLGQESDTADSGHSAESPAGDNPSKMDGLKGKEMYLVHLLGWAWFKNHEL